MDSHSHPILQSFKEDENVEDKVWTKIFKTPFIKRCKNIMESWEIREDVEVKEVLLPSHPPWTSSKIKLEEELITRVKKDQCPVAIKAIALDTIHRRYGDHLRIYTDGSKIDDSTTAAMWIPSLGVEDKWKLNHGKSRSIMGAELYAISRALHWLVLNQPLLTCAKVAILSDSKSGIMAIKNRKSRSYSHLTNQIRNLGNMIEDSEVELAIQWVPSHVDLADNEHVDGLAKSAHDLREESVAPLDQKEVKKMINLKLQRVCQLQYEAVREDLHIGGIKSYFEHWSWASSKNRKIETALARLRIGHTRLKQNMHRFNLEEDPNCSTCRTEETPQHLLEACRRFEVERLILHQSLYRLGVRTPNTKTLLGGGNHDPATQEKIKEAVEVFLTSSGAIDLL